VEVKSGQRGAGAQAPPTRRTGKPSKEELAALQAQLNAARRARDAAQSIKASGTGTAGGAGAAATGAAGLWSSLDEATKKRLLELRHEAQRQKQDQGGGRGGIEAPGSRDAEPLSSIPDLEQRRSALLAARDAARAEARRVVATSAASDDDEAGVSQSTGQVGGEADQVLLPTGGLEQLSHEQTQRDTAAAAAAAEEADAAAASVRASAALTSAVELREQAESELLQLKRQAAAFKARDAATKSAKAAAEARAQAAALTLEQRRAEEKEQQAATQRRRAELELARLKLELEALRAQSAAAAKASAEKHAAAAALAAADVRRAAAASAAADAAAAARAAEDARTLERTHAAKKAAQAALKRLQAELEAARSGAPPPSQQQGMAAGDVAATEDSGESQLAGGAPPSQDGEAAREAAPGDGAASDKQQQEPGGNVDEPASEPLAPTHLGRAMQRITRARSVVASTGRFHAWMRTQGGGAAANTGAHQGGLALPSATDGADERAAHRWGEAGAPETGDEVDKARVRAQAAADAAAAAEAALLAVEDLDPEFDVDKQDGDGLTGEALAARRQAAAAHAEAVSSARSAAASARQELDSALAELAGVREATRQVKRVAEESAVKAAQSQVEVDAATMAALQAVLHLADRHNLPHATAAGSLVLRLGNATSWDSNGGRGAFAALDDPGRWLPWVSTGASDAPLAFSASAAAVMLAVVAVAVAASGGSGVSKGSKAGAPSAALAAGGGKTTSPLLLLPFDALSEAEQLRVAALRASAQEKLTWGAAALGPPYTRLLSAPPYPPSAAQAAYCNELRRIATEWAAAAPSQRRPGASTVAVGRHRAGSRCVAALLSLACGHATSEESSAAALGALANLAMTSPNQPGWTPSLSRLARAGAMEAACVAMCRFSAAPDVAATACVLIARLATTLPVLLRMHKAPHGPTADACAGAVIAAAAAFRADVRVQQAAAGALWALLLARGGSVQALALHAGAHHLLLAGLQDHALSAECVRNVCGALVCLCCDDGVADLRASGDAHMLVWADRSTILGALHRHGGGERLMGRDVTASAPWMVAPPSVDYAGSAWG
jgi:hypothetical protein